MQKHRARVQAGCGCGASHCPACASSRPSTPRVQRKPAAPRNTRFSWSLTAEQAQAEWDSSFGLELAPSSGFEEREAERLSGETTHGVVGEHMPARLPSDLSASIERERGGGRPIPADLRHPMEVRLGADLSGARIHDDAVAAGLAAALNAEAFTVGSDIFFAQGAYRPAAADGQQLIAHELVHVFQQRDGNARVQRNDEHNNAYLRRHEIRMEMEPDVERATTGMSIRFIIRSPEAIGPDPFEVVQWFVNRGGFRFGESGIYPGRAPFTHTFEFADTYRVMAKLRVRRNDPPYHRGEDIWVTRLVRVGEFDSRLRRAVREFRPSSVAEVRWQLDAHAAEAEAIELPGAAAPQARPYITSSVSNPTIGRAGGQDVRYRVHPSRGAHRFRWFVTTSEPIGSHWGNRFARLDEQIGGRWVATYPLAEAGRVATWYLGPAANLYHVTAQELDEHGEPTGGEARFHHRVLGANSEQAQSIVRWRRYLRHVDDSLTRIPEENRTLIRAVHLARASGILTELFLVTGEDRNGRMLLLDLTPGAETTVYDDRDTVRALIGRLVQYPAGVIEYERETAGGRTVRGRLVTTGEDAHARAAETFGWISFGAAVAGVVLLFVPGGQGLAPILFQVAAATGIASGVESVVSRLSRDNPDVFGIAIDVLGIVANLLSLGAAAVTRQAISRAFNAASYGVETGEAVVVAYDHLDQIAAVLSAPTNQEQKRRELIQLIASALVSGGVTLHSLRSAGTPRAPVARAGQHPLLRNATSLERGNLLRESGRIDGPLRGRHLQNEIDIASTRPGAPIDRVIRGRRYDLEVDLGNTHYWRRDAETGLWCRFTDIPKNCGTSITPRGPAQVASDDYRTGWERTFGPTAPSREPDPTATPRGRPARISPADDPTTVRSRRRENDAAQRLAQHGYDVEQSPAVTGQSRPDYRVEGRIFDAYAPTSSRARNIWSEVLAKIERDQTERIILILDDTAVDRAALRQQFTEYTVPGLREVIALDGSRCYRLFP